LTDPNNNTERFFNYYARPNWNSNPMSSFEAVRCQGTPCSANAADNTSRWVRINLTTGRITKSVEY
jgi:hypothetical protein